MGCTCFWVPVLRKVVSELSTGSFLTIVLFSSSSCNWRYVLWWVSGPANSIFVYPDPVKCINFEVMHHSFSWKFKGGPAALCRQRRLHWPHTEPDGLQLQEGQDGSGKAVQGGRGGGEEEGNQREEEQVWTGKRWQTSAIAVAIFPSFRPFRHQKAALPRSQEWHF